MFLSRAIPSAIRMISGFGIVLSSSAIQLCIQFSDHTTPAWSPPVTHAPQS
jgi:hypothetical protein